MFSPLNPYSPETQPLTRFRGVPVYLSTALVVAHVAALFLAAIVGMGAWAGWFAYVTPSAGAGMGAQVWRWLTYVFVHYPDLWFVLDMVFLYFLGMRLEQTLGRNVFLRLYGALILLAPAVTLLADVAGVSPSALAGTRLVHFCLFLSICFMEPRAPFFFNHPAFQAKYVGGAFFFIYVLDFLGARNIGILMAFVAGCAFTYLYLRRNGLPARFGQVSSAFREVLPQRPQSPRRNAASGASAKTPTPKYEAKIRPREDLAPEKKAVEEVDALLDKIARSGMDSLTPAEREKLRRASERLQKPD